MRFFLFLSLAFSVPAPSLAAEEVRWQNTPRGTLYWTMHTEAGKTYLEKFRQRPGRLQERLEQKSYGNEAGGRAAFDFLTENFHRGANPAAVTTGTLSELSPTEKIWTATETWSWEWEKKFEEWMRANADQDFFFRHEVATDCADAALAFRWIFARSHGLPAANTLAATGIVFSNESMKEEWAALPTAERWQDDQRFRAALDFLLNNTYTHTLLRDLYPVTISREAVLPGTIFIHLDGGVSGHTEILYDISDLSANPEPIRILASDVPRAVRRLNEYGMQDWGYPPTEGMSGLLRFRWPVKTDARWDLAPQESMPFFSREQFEPSFVEGRQDFTRAVIFRLLPNWRPDYPATMRAKINQLITRFQARVKIVEDGFAFCSQNPGACAEGTAGWESWSTPSRDSAILRVISGVDELYGDDSCSRACRHEMNGRLDENIITVDGQPQTLDEVMSTWRSRNFSSDPTRGVKERWGL